MVEYIAVFFSTIGIITTIVVNEIVSYHEGRLTELEENILLGYSALCTFGLTVAIYLRYDQYLEWYKTRNLLTEYDTLVSTGWWQNMVKE